MIRMENTANLAGVTISGDYYDFETVVDAFYQISIDEKDQKHTGYRNVSTRILGICYDIRHAMMGDRDILLTENGMNNERMAFHSQITPRHNLYYSCNILYPEMLFAMKVLNDLVKLYMESLVKPSESYFAAMSKEVLWDKHIPIIRSFQSAFTDCLKEVLTPNSFVRWKNLVFKSYTNTAGFCLQYLDLKNIEYLEINREQRLKKLSVISKRLADYDNDSEYSGIREHLREESYRQGCHPGDLKLIGYDYPDEIDW